MEKAVSWKAGVRVVVRVTAAVVLWLEWVHYADVVAFRPPYGRWRCQLAHASVIGDPAAGLGLLVLELLLLPASFGVVKLIETGSRLHGRKRWLSLAAAVAMVALITLAYAVVVAVAAVLHPAPDYFVPQCS